VAAGLTEKQRRFCEEYLIDLNATRAYLAAYPAVKKESTAAQAGSRMLRNVKVAEHIRERMEDRQKRTEITQDRVLRELAAIAFADVTDIVSYNGGRVVIKPTEDVPRETRKIIAGIKEGQYGTEVKTYDRIRALELLGKHLGMFDQKKDDLDRKEQEARIAKLQREAQRDDETKEISVSIMGMGVDEIAEILQ
jgi:phage terminase small subunit